MRDSIILAKTLLKANYGINLKTKEGKKAIATVLLLAFCLIPTFGMLYMFFQKIFAISSLTLLGMELAFAAICMLVLWTSLFTFPSIFYFSNDLQYLLVLPVKPRAIVTGKFITVYFSILVTCICAMVPLLAAYIQSGNSSIISILLYLPQIFLLGLVPAFLASIFWMIVLRVLPFFKNKDRFNMITGAISIVLAIGIGLGSSSLGRSIDDPQALIHMLQNEPEGLMTIVRIFFHVPFAARAIVEPSILNFLISIALCIVFGFVFFLCADHLYLASARDSKTTTTKKKKELEFRKKSKIGLTYFFVEMKRLIRTPAYMSNCVLSSLVMPIMFIIIVFITPEIKEVKEMTQNLDVENMINLPLLAMSIGAILGFFNGSLNGISATAFSREGKNLSFIKYIPYSFAKQVWIKMSIGIFFSVLSNILILISIHRIIAYPIWYDLFFVIGTLITSILVNCIGILVDGLHPKLDWDDEMSAIKNNMNIIFEFLISWGILVIFIVPIFTTSMFDLNNWEFYAAFTLIMFSVVTIAAFFLTPKMIEKHLHKIS